MTTTNEYPQLFEIDTDVGVNVATFTADGKYLVGGTTKDVRVWQVADGKQVKAMPVEGSVPCIATSRDGRWIAGGTMNGDILVWNAATYEQVIVDKSKGEASDIDFSPDANHIVFVNQKDAATVWDIVVHRKVRTLSHGPGLVYAAKYSSQGNRITTASAAGSVRIWDSSDGRLLLDIKVTVRGWGSFLWHKDHLFVRTNDGKIRQVDATTGTTVSEWSVPDSGRTYIALPQHAKFVAHSADETITLWDTTTHTQLGRIPHTSNIFSFVFSPDDSLLAIAHLGSKVTVRALFRPLSDPKFDIDSVALDAWTDGQLTGAEALLSAAFPTSEDTAHHVLASRALVRARLGQWDTALVDAEKSIESQRSLVGYIAKCVALVGKGEKDNGCGVCDIACLHFPSDHTTLLLIKAVVLFMVGEHVDAISRMDDLNTDRTDFMTDPALCVIQERETHPYACMRLLLGNKLMERSDYGHAVQSFEDARLKLGNRVRQPPLIISLISGWTFGGLEITIQQRLCEALFAAGRIKEAGKSVLLMTAQDIDMSEPDKAWVSDFKYRCRSKLEDLGDRAVDVSQNDEAISQYTAALSLDPPNPQDLLVKRSNVWVSKGAQENALSDAKAWARLMLTSSSWKDALTTGVGFRLERFAIDQVVCDHLEMTGRVTDAIACFRQISREFGQEKDGEKANWTHDFKSRCCRKLEDLGDNATNVGQYDEAVLQYTVALSLDVTSSRDLLVKRSNALVGKGAREDALNDAQEWAKLMLKSGSWEEALPIAVGSTLARFTIYRAVCEHLETIGHVIDAVACFHQTSSEIAQDKDDEQANWTHDFRLRCRDKLETLGDSATNAGQHDEAISQYTAGLSLDPANPQDLFVKRSTAYAARGQWKDALDDANKVIKLDPSSLPGYERKYAALLGIGHHSDATDVFEAMLSKMAESSDPEIRERSRHYIQPEQTRRVIREAIKDAIRDVPLVLINLPSGRLCNKSEQAAAFESTPAFTTLIRSKHIDHALIEKVVGEFYRYATLSHTWEGNEPLYDKVIETVVYNLEVLPTHEKLQMFCKIVRGEGFNWAWSDTCCIDKGDHFVLQEALVSMFKWYEGSAMTIIFLCDVDRLAKLGALMRSLWNSRGWTLQEYHASKVVRIYTKDWTPYLGLTIYNHKESPEIISEMEQATGISSQALVALCPGLNDIREKLRLASTRQTTRVEDAAYSLLGIFSMTLPVTYGEGDKALGRLLSQLLMSSGDTSILAWTGISGSFNSCLPTTIVVFSEPLTSHIPPAISDAEMELTIARLHASLSDVHLARRLYDQVDGLPTPNFAGQRMRLPCLAFKITPTLPWNESDIVFRAQAGMLGVVEIKTRQSLARLDSLYLIHPWIDFLLDRRATGNVVEMLAEEDASSDLDEFFDASSDLGSTSDTDPLDSMSFPSLSTAPLTDAQRPIYQFLARLRQPFGALLLAPTRRNVAEYRRIATEGLITVQVQEITSSTLDELMQGVRVLDVL